MIIGIGIDLVEIRRVKQALNKNKSGLKRLFTDAEIKYCRGKRNSSESFAVRFAAKEAFMKAVGIGWGTKKSPKWNEIEVVTRDNKPSLKFYGKAKVIAGNLGARNTHISMSHTKEYAMAIVAVEN